MCKGLRYIIKFIFFYILFCTASACTSLGPHYEITSNGQKFKTYSIYRPFVGVCEYRGGYWGDWSRDDYLRYEVNETSDGFEIVYFKKYNHPSDFEYKIIAKQYRNRDDKWLVYDGEIHIKASNEAQMRSKYKKDMAGVEALKDVWFFSAKIIRTYDYSLPKEMYVFPKLPADMMYVYNVYYNGVGRAFAIYGKWVGADQYDSWE